MFYAIEFVAVFVTNNGHVSFYAMSVPFMTHTDMYTSSDKIKSSLFVFICVALSVLEIIGGAYFMGLTIEIVTSIVLILRYKRSNKDFNPSCNLSVGLALDYAAHIGVTYVVTKGRSRKERAQASVARLFFCAFFV